MKIELATAQNRRLWPIFCLSILVLPFFPALGTLGLVGILFLIWCRQYRQLTQNNWNLILLGGLLILSSFTAEDNQAAWLGLANFLPYFALFAALQSLIISSRQLLILARLIILPILPVVILGWGQLYGNWQSPQIIDTILGWELVSQGIPPGRMSSVFIYANFLAVYLAIAFSLTLGLWLSTWQSHSQKYRNVTLCWLTFTLVAEVSGLILTSSRNAWGLIIFSLLAYGLYYGWTWLVWGLIGSAGIICWASFLPDYGGNQLRSIVPEFIWARLSDQSYQRPVETLRITQWQFCWDLIQQRPGLGWGLRNFTPLYEAKMGTWLGHPHNFWLMFGAETGIAASVLLIVTVATILIQASFLLRQLPTQEKLIYFSYLVALSSCFIFNFTDVTVFDLRINLITWILLAAIAGHDQHKSDVTTRQSQNH